MDRKYVRQFKNNFDAEILRNEFGLQQKMPINYIIKKHENLLKKYWMDNLVNGDEYCDLYNYIEAGKGGAENGQKNA